MNRTMRQNQIVSGLLSKPEQLERHFAKLATIGVCSDGAISRIAYTDEESRAIAYVRSEGESFGLVGTYDEIGNLYLALPGEFEKRVLVGSHLDSVPHGGNYDGAAGVLAGLEALRDLVPIADQLKVGVELVVWRGEEYTYNAVYKGSAAAFGLSETHVLHNTYQDISLRDAILSQGFDPACIDEARPALPQDVIDSILGYYELHIEQGVRLERDSIDLAVVTSIAGDRRFLVVLEGRFDHSGATPMGTSFRSDVNLAMAYIQVRLDELGARRRAEGREFVQTVGIVNADPDVDRKYPEVHGNSVTKVSGLGYFTLDIMSPDDDWMDSYAAEVLRLVWQTAKEFGVKAVIEQTDSACGLKELDQRMVGHLRAGVKKLGYSMLEMPSGAGHDAVVVAQAERSDGARIPVGMLFVPCEKGISHAKEEKADPADVAKGSDVLREAIAKIATAGAT